MAGYVVACSVEILGNADRSSLIGRALLKDTSFVVRICQDEKDILQYRNIELLAEHAGGLFIGLLCHVVYQFDAHYETDTFNITIVMAV